MRFSHLCIKKIVHRRQQEIKTTKYPWHGQLITDAELNPGKTVLHHCTACVQLQWCGTGQVSFKDTQRWHSHRLWSGDKESSIASCSCGRMPEKSTTSRKDDEAETTMDQDNKESVGSTTNSRLRSGGKGLKRYSWSRGRMPGSPTPRNLQMSQVNGKY
ncbi:hypothetical protein QAD02_002224 [Eretmocerus hayati]|uniref:Uncharacterized protein n=1 Tax=Eretmocerus hayati TaxID=131215 RepID=A0ACC2NN46_9HYME|nr:hypothetical protein QAD02_002224 [Eretmocerus hayati]